MASSPEYHNGLRIAVEGCGHGKLNVMYDTIRKAQEANNFTVDVLIICGDFQAVRNINDLAVMSCPVKYRELGDFHEYYSGARVAPVLTLYIGGNHEASNHHAELFHGGWVAPNIYYLGAAGVLQVGSLRIAGLSGIYKSHDYNRPHLETLPYYPAEIKSIYHIRAYDVFKLFQLSGAVDVMLSHDWPAGIEHHGDIGALFRQKPFFIEDSRSGKLGSPPAESLMRRLKPRYWFAGHLHVKFSAVVEHEREEKKEEAVVTAPPVEKNPDELELDLEDEAATAAAVAAPNKNPDELELDLDDDTPAAAAAAAAAAVITKNPDELDLDLDDDDTPAATHRPGGEGVNSAPPATAPPPCTRFLALDKALPSRDFLQILTIPFSTPLPEGRSRTALTYDPDFLAITRFMDSYPGNNGNAVTSLRSLRPAALTAELDKHREWVHENIVAQGKLEVPRNFEVTAPVQAETVVDKEQPRPYRNPQAAAFCELLGIRDRYSMTEEEWEHKKELLKSKPPRESELRRWGHGGGSGSGGRGGRGSGSGRG